MLQMTAKAVSRITVLSFGTIVGLGLSTQAFAAEGKYDNTFCFTSKATEVIEVGGFKAGNFETHGIRMGAEGDPFRAMAQHCVGQFTIINGEQEDTVRCEGANAAGDKVFGVATRKFDTAKPGGEGSFRILGGTGKFAGISGEGHSKITDVISHTPEHISGCAHSWGTYTIK